MPHATEDALTYCARIRDLVLHHSGGWADADALRRFRLLSYAASRAADSLRLEAGRGGRAASRAADDAQCAEIMHTAEQYAADLFSATAHQKWARTTTSGADMLRLCILSKLDAFRDRLNQLQAAGRPDLADDRMFYSSDE